MKTILYHPVLFMILLFLDLLLYPKAPLIIVLCLCGIWFFRTNSKSVFLVVVLFFLIPLPRFQTGYPDFTEGRVIQISPSYCVLQKKFQKVIVYTKQDLDLDGIYRIDVPFEQIEKRHGFYQFDFAGWTNRNGIFYAASADLKKVSNSPTLRYFIQKLIRRKEDADMQVLLMRMLLNIRADKELYDDPLLDNGFSLSGILAVISVLLSFCLTEKTQKRVLFVFKILLCLLYHFPMLVVYSFLKDLFELFRLSDVQKKCFCLCVVMILYPGKVTSLTFLFPFSFVLSGILYENDWFIRMNISLILQSILFHEMNPIMNLAFNLLKKLYGIVWLYCVLCLYLPFRLSFVFTLISFYLKCMKYFAIPGSCIGFGTLFYVLLILSIRKKKYCSMFAYGLLLVFQLFGLFHPLSEVAFLSVGQGDSILIRQPLQNGNILIDTGKENAFTHIDTILKAKGIHYLDALIITHPDSDHAGGKENIQTFYHPRAIIEHHQEKLEIGRMVFYDLNEIKNEDENQSSIVDYFEWNGLKYLMMGDADQKTETSIIRKYPHLHADILKLSHHGSKTGSNEDFLDCVKPSLAIVSAGRYQIYHHPSFETVQKLLQRHIPYFNTNEEGDISIFCLGFCNILITSSLKVAIIPRL